MAPYQYRPIESDNHIRILYIDPTDDDEQQLSGTLVHTDVTDQPVYDALSYFWGPPDLCRKILIDGQELAVTVNLELALKRVRARRKYGSEVQEGPIPIWADGVCVNQNDTQERSHQVRLMSQIYSNCQAGLIYLGEEADGSHDAYLFMESIRDCSIIDLASIFDKTRVGDGVQRFITLLSRPWFRRIWVIQEFALPRKVRMICGSWDVAGEQVHVFSHVVQALAEAQHMKAVYNDWPTANCNFLVDTRIQLGRSLGPTAAESPEAVPRSLPLFRLLSEACAFEATDPRDHYFALLGLVSYGTRDGDLVADYSKTLEQVEMEFARHFVDDGYGLAMLNSGCHVQERPSTYPSWLPNWAGRFPQPFGRIWNYHEHKQSDPKTVYMATLPGDGRTLLVECCRIEAVKAVGSPIVGGGKGLWNGDWLREMEKMTVESTIYPSGIDVEEAMWRSIIADRTVEQVRPARQDYGTLYQNLRQSPVLGNITFSAAVATTGSVRFCITTEGFFGLVPSYAEVGDIIVTIKGDKVQAMYAVRKRVADDNDDDVAYTWLGQAYVHDLWKVKKYEELEWEVLRIK
ncbi:heterokaryon incompatibility protein-domain-containing protein [Sordaria brevicollis]|uniref:Heterokaryon incompatibility protein-domain-containing protein n=1 Tax=Sordaria brevicollis TaxID=83679 RepID=A0AAE0P3D8_SORBR|nr:heterokaryon incompatibility protein-domain-containing protein [Sordaria brevicollis]